MGLRRNFESFGGAAYAFAMARPWLSTRYARVVWRGDLRPFYERMRVVEEAPRGGVVVDCPSGSGVAFAAVAGRTDLDYVAVDASPAMLERGRVAAMEMGLEHVRCLEADAGALPLADAEADVYFSNWGLHCFEDPQRALVEAARVLRPGGELHGCCFVQSDEWFLRRVIKPGVSVFRAVGYRSEVEDWIRAAGFGDLRTEAHGPMLYFDARRAGIAESA